MSSVRMMPHAGNRSEVDTPSVRMMTHDGNRSEVGISSVPHACNHGNHGHHGNRKRRQGAAPQSGNHGNRLPSQGQFQYKYHIAPMLPYRSLGGMVIEAVIYASLVERVCNPEAAEGPRYIPGLRSDSAVLQH